MTRTTSPPTNLSIQSDIPKTLGPKEDHRPPSFELPLPTHETFHWLQLEGLPQRNHKQALYITRKK